jgi:hypothetical protein
MDPASLRSAMGYRISLDRGVLRAELFGRETVEETKTFFQAVVSTNSERRSSCILISIRSSKPIFQLERNGLIGYFRELAATSARRIALLADTNDLQLSHEYFEVIAGQHGLNVRSFPHEAAAQRWFEDPRRERERRHQLKRRRQQVALTLQERRAGLERRHAERRNTTAAATGRTDKDLRSSALAVSYGS